MSEIKRVLLSKRYILLVIALFIANIAVFQYSQMNTLEEINSDESLDMFIDELEDKQATQHEDFYKKLQNVPKEKEKMLEISIFSDKDSFSYKNIMKTEKDYRKISDVELSDINDYAVDAFLEYDIVYIFSFIIMVFTVISFLDERKRGLWQIVYVCRSGRLKLIIKRLLILFTVSVVTETVLITSVLSVSFMDYGGADILSQSVQSVGKLQDFVLPISLLEFMVYYILFLSAALAVSGLLIWLVLSFIHNGSLGMITCSFIYVIEFFLNYFISSRNPLCIFKYTNLWFLIDPREVFTSYTNFMFAGFMFNIREYLSVMLVVLIILLSIGVIITGIVTKPFYSPGIIETYVCKVLDRLRKVLCHFNGMGYELFKMLVQKKGIIVIAGLFYVFITNIDTTELFLSPERIQLDNFYASYTCEINAKSMKAYNQIQEDINASIINKEDVNGTKLNMFELLKKQKNYAESLKYRGIKGWFINDRGYKLLFGELKSVKRVIDGVLALFAIVLIVAPIYVSEYQSGVNYLIASTKRGKGTIFRRKMLYCLVCTCIISITMLSVQLYEVRLKYNLVGLSAPVQNIEMLGDVPFSISIGGFIALWYILRTLIMIMSACIIMLISGYGKKQNRVYLFSVLLIPLGIVNGMSNYPSNFSFILTIIVPLFMCITISVVCIIKTYKKWTNK